MKRRQLLITKFSYDYSEIIKSLYPHGHIVWLQLWPVINTNDITLLYPEIEIVKSTDLIKNEDHFKIAREVTNVSNNWWKILGLNSFDSEWNISGLKISKIFCYEIEQVLTNIYFRERAINYSIKKFNPDSLIFVDKENKKINCDDVLKNASNYSLYNFFKNKFKNIDTKQYKLTFNLTEKNNIYIDKLKKILRKKPSYYLRITKRNVLNFLPKNNGIVVSNSFRCIQPIEDFSTLKRRVYIHNDDDYLLNGYKNQLLSNIKYYKKQKLFFDI